MFLKGEYRSLYIPTNPLPILSPLVLSLPTLSPTSPSSNSLYLLHCRCLSVFPVLHLPAHSSLFPPPSSLHPPPPPLSISFSHYQICLFNLSVFQIVALISKKYEKKSVFFFIYFFSKPSRQNLWGIFFPPSCCRSTRMHLFH